MNAVEKSRLTKEASMQMAALKRINLWKNIAIALSTIGIALAYAGAAGHSQNIFLSILGIIIIIVGIICALILNLGLKNGRRNVGKILDILDSDN